MLIDFTVENYRSIKDPVTLSAVAAPKRTPRAKTSTNAQSVARRNRIVPDEEIAQTYVVPSEEFNLLPTLGIFGANASGKSNVVRAIESLLSLVAIDEADHGSILILFQPFRLSANTTKQPTKFCIRLLIDSIVYKYTIALSPERIQSEKLEYVSLTSVQEEPKVIFDRSWQSDTKIYQWNSYDDNSLFSAVQNNLSSHIPFLRFLIKYFDLPKLASLKIWLTKRLHGTAFLDANVQREIAVDLINRFEYIRSNIVDFLRRFDTGIDDLKVINADGDDSKWLLLATHNTQDGPVNWPFREESRGTQHLLELANKVSYSLSLGSLLLEDELGSNIHPNITREIIKLFQSEKTNPKHAQLIFTSHDNTLQRHNLLRRDQIWFTEKRADGSTNLYPLTDFKPRNDLALDQAYLDGRFGAVPILPATEDLLPQSIVEVQAEPAG